MDTIPTMLRSRVIAFAGAVLASATAATPAAADTVSGTIGVVMNVTNACVVNDSRQFRNDVGTIGNINFPDQPGVIGTIEGELVGTLGALQVLCSPGIAPQLTVGPGANDSAGKRRLASNGNMIDYRLFSDAARTAELGIGSSIALATATSTPITVPIYARVTGNGAVVAAGRYTDTVRVTLTW